MEFGNAPFLFGALLGAVPLIIHLAGRRRARTLKFPSLAFLVQVDRALARRYKMRERILLALRIAAVCLVALGLALPRVRSERAGWMGDRLASTVFVVDNSLSMSARSGGISLLERSKQAVAAWLGNLGAGERAAVVPIYGAATALTTDHRAQAEAAARIEPSYGRASLGAALERAVRMLADETASLKQIIVASDFQQANPPPRLELPEGTILIALKAMAEVGPNVVPREFRVAAEGPQGVEVIAGIANRGSVAARGDGTLLAGEKEAARRTTLIPAGGFVTEAFRFKELPGDLLRVHVACPEDVLQEDNDAYLAVRRHETIAVLLVKERESDVAYLDDAFWLSTALSVRGGRIAVTTVRTSEFADLAIDRFQAIFLAGVSRLGIELAAQLSAYARGGGMVVFVAGDAMDLAAFRTLGEGAFPLFPALPQDFVALKGVPIGAMDEGHAAIRALRALRPEPDLRSAAFRKIVRIEEPQAPVRCVIRLENGMPLLIERRHGEGIVCFFAASLTPRWTTLPLRVAFVPFLHAFVAAAANVRALPESLTCGETLVLPGRFAAATLAGPPGRVAAVPEGERVLFGPLELPGLYALSMADEAVEHIAVNAPAIESDLAPLSREKIAELLGAKVVVPLEDPQAAVAQAREMGLGRELRNFFLVAFLLFACVEGILAGLWAFRR